MQSHGAQVDRSHSDGRQPDAEGEPTQVVPEEEARTERPAAQEDACDATSPDKTRAGHSVSQGAEETTRFPDAQVRR